MCTVACQNPQSGCSWLSRRRFVGRARTGRGARQAHAHVLCVGVRVCDMARARNPGKSALTIQFAEGHFVDAYSPTIENTCSCLAPCLPGRATHARAARPAQIVALRLRTVTKTIDVDGESYRLLIADTAGQDEYSLFHSQYSLGIHGYILVYNIASRTSFETLRVINEKILNYTGTDYVPRVLVGNKSDLEFERQVTYEQGRALADAWGCAFVETSAKHNAHVDDLFRFIVREIEKNSRPEVVETKGCTCVLL